MAVSMKHPLFKRIHDDHQKIDQLIKNCSDESLSKKSLELLFDFAENQHHYKEEDLLFKAIYEYPQLVTGGPLCMFYMDDYILNHPVDTLNQLTGLNIDIPERLRSYYETGSNLRVPLNEHLAGNKLLSELIKKYEEHSILERQKLFKLYTQIHSSNKSKEENCFLHLCSTLLTEEQANTILEKWSNTSM